MSGPSFERAPRVVVVGAGMAGLASAIDLAARGADVTLFEKEGEPGGKVQRVDLGGEPVDVGPTVLTMRWVFDDLFASVGRSLSDYASLDPCSVLARHTWTDGATLDLFAERERTEAAIAHAFGAAEAGRYVEFMNKARRIYETVEQPFLRSQRPSFASVLFRPGSLGFLSLARIDAHRTMWRALESSFRDPHLVQLFARYATYCGSSPFEANATLNLIAHVEGLGVHRVVGGMASLAAGLARLATELGVSIVYGAEVERVSLRDARVSHVHLKGGRSEAADAVVLNTDIAALSDGLLGEGVRDAARLEPALPGDRSLSAVTWALRAEARGTPLLHHNVFFSADYPAEFAALARGEVPREPTVYLCAEDRGDEVVAAPLERMFIIVNAPATGDAPGRWVGEERRRCENDMMGTLGRCGLTLGVQAKAQTTPADFAARFPGTGGALYGPKARGALSPFRRASARTKVPGLYLAGGSIHPGPGVPMATLSGRRAAEAVREDFASTLPWHPAVTSGTTSTGRVTTASGRS